MNRFKTQVTDRLLQVVWLFENVLGRYADDVAYNQRKELAKKMLAEVYGYKDIYEFIKPERDVESMDRFLKTAFTYYDNVPPWQNNIKPVT